MATIATIPTNSCLVQTSRKRKRSSELHVSFSTQPHNVAYTYSQTDYDRGGLIPEIDNQQQQQQQQYILTLKINFFQEEKESIINHIEKTETPIIFTKKTKLNNKRPKLTINTSNLSGPLYFTNMTTNHQKKRLLKQELDTNDDEKEEIDILTKENTRRNSLPLVLC